MTRGLFASAQAGTCGTSISFMAGCELRKTCEIGAEQMEFDPPLPHLDHRHLLGAGPEQRRLGVELLEIPAYGDRFTR